MMADRVVIAKRGVSRLSSDTVIGGALLLVVAVVLRFLVHYALPYFGFDPAYFGDFWPHRVRLIFHICGGALALSCGPFQFWTGLRQRAMHFHKWTGRLYLIGVLVGSIGAFLIGVYSKPQNFGVALMSLAVAWIAVTGTAYAAILRGLVNLHKEWMVKSYLLTFAFVTFRLLNDNLSGLAQHLGGSVDERSANITWISWLLPLAIYEATLQWRKIFATRQLA
jgi:hypothetical protein